MTKNSVVMMLDAHHREEYHHHHGQRQPVGVGSPTRPKKFVQKMIERRWATCRIKITANNETNLNENHGDDDGNSRSDKIHKMKKLRQKQYIKADKTNNNNDHSSIRMLPLQKRNKQCRRTKWCLLGGLLIMTLVSLTIAFQVENPNLVSQDKGKDIKFYNDLKINLKVCDSLRTENSNDNFAAPPSPTASVNKKPRGYKKFYQKANHTEISSNNNDNKGVVLEMSSNNIMPTFLALARQDSPNLMMNDPSTAFMTAPAIFPSSNLQQQPISARETANMLSIGETQIAPVSSSPWLPAEPLIAADSKKKKMMKKKKKMEKKHKEWKKGKKHKKKKYESKKKKGGMSKKKKGKKEKKKWGMEKKGHKKKGNFKKKKWGKKKKMKKGQKKGKKGHKMLKDKGHKKKGFKKVYHKEEWGKKKKWHDIKREKKWNTKQKKWKKKWHQEKGKKYKGKHMKKYHKKNKHGKKYKKEKKSKWKKHKGEKFKKGHKKKKEEYSKKKEGGKKKKMKKMKKEMKKKKKG